MAVYKNSCIDWTLFSMLYLPPSPGPPELLLKQHNHPAQQLNLVKKKKKNKQNAEIPFSSAVYLEWQCSQLGRHDSIQSTDASSSLLPHKSQDAQCSIVIVSYSHSHIFLPQDPVILQFASVWAPSCPGWFSLEVSGMRSLGGSLHNQLHNTFFKPLPFCDY